MPKRQKQKKEKKKEESDSEEERENQEDEEAEDEDEEKEKKNVKEEEDPKGDTGKVAESSGPSGDSEAAAAPSAPSAPPPPPLPEFKAHTDYPPMESAVVVQYSPFSGLPPDFCQFAPTWDKDKPWCMENFPQYYPELSGVSLEDAKKTAEDASAKSKEKLLPGGKKKRDASPHISIRLLTRGGRKCVTTVNGLDGFGVDMEGVAKKFKKKFACGCAVVKDNAGCDMVEIQGDFVSGGEVVDALCDQFPEVTPEKVSIMDSATKKKGKGK
jgi:density-regulated protein DRP1